MVNSKLKTAAGEASLFVSSKCEGLNSDFEQVVYEENSRDIDKGKDKRRTHLSDALGIWCGKNLNRSNLSGSRTGGCFEELTCKNMQLKTNTRDSSQNGRCGGDTATSMPEANNSDYGAADYLIQRHKEPVPIYYERLSRVFYENYIGSIIDWFSATLLRREPVVQFNGEDNYGRRFFDLFIQDCDRKGTTLSDFFRRQITDTLVYGTSYMVVDFPASPAGFKPRRRRCRRDVASLSDTLSSGASY